MTQDLGVPFGPGSTSLRSPEPLRVSSPAGVTIPDAVNVAPVVSRREREEQPDFACAICERQVEMRWNWRNAIIPPICLFCEQWYLPRASTPRHGSFRDRREVCRGFAIAEALANQAALKKWRSDHGRA